MAHDNRGSCGTRAHAEGLDRRVLSVLTAPNRLRVAVIAIVIASSLLLLTPEAYRFADLFDEVIQGPREWLQSAERNAPPAKLPRRVGDAARYPRASFGFVLEYPYGERVDT